MCEAVNVLGSQILNRITKQRHRGRGRSWDLSRDKCGHQETRCGTWEGIKHRQLHTRCRLRAGMTTGDASRGVRSWPAGISSCSWQWVLCQAQVHSLCSLQCVYDPRREPPRTPRRLASKVCPIRGVSP